MENKNRQFVYENFALSCKYIFQSTLKSNFYTNLFFYNFVHIREKVICIDKKYVSTLLHSWKHKRHDKRKVTVVKIYKDSHSQPSPNGVVDWLKRRLLYSNVLNFNTRLNQRGGMNTRIVMLKIKYFISKFYFDNSDVNMITYLMKFTVIGNNLCIGV